MKGVIDLEMTFNRYMDNPSSGTSVYSMREYYRNIYKNKFDNLLVREQGNIKYTVYKTDNSTDTFYIHIKVPSESLSGLYYDVVIELSTQSNDLKSRPNLREYHVRFFSNDHAFCYTFAHAFNKNGLFIPILKSKMIEKCLKERGSNRNPRDDVWYVKSLCFAYYTMERYNLFNRSTLTQNSIKFVSNTLLNNVMHAASKSEEYNRLNIAKQQSTKAQKNRERHALQTSNIHSTKITRTTKVSKVSNITKHTPRTKIK